MFSYPPGGNNLHTCVFLLGCEEGSNTGGRLLSFMGVKGKDLGDNRFACGQKLTAASATFSDDGPPRVYLAYFGGGPLKNLSFEI